MMRRSFITVLGGAASWPLVAHAQQPERVRRVGVLIAFPESDPFAQAFVAAFTTALRRLGWLENIRLVFRFAAGDPALFKAYAAELAGSSPDAILTGNTPAAAALRQQTHRIPIVFVLVADPVSLGFVQSVARPGGNITGFSAFDPPIMGQWLQLLKEVAPAVTRVAVIFNPDTAPYASSADRPIEAAASSLGLRMTLAPLHDIAGIEDVIAAIARAWRRSCRLA
jgi:putative tryptophan/tyrosine transport system substrate-binding protein